MVVVTKQIDTYLILLLVIVGELFAMFALTEVVQLWVGLDGRTELVWICAAVRKLWRTLDVFSRTMVRRPLRVLRVSVNVRCGVQGMYALTVDGLASMVRTERVWSSVASTTTMLVSSALR